MDDPATLPLRDIHLPGAPSWWPPAPGWWALMLLAVLIALALFWYLRMRSRRRVHRAALAEIEDITREFELDADRHRLAARLSALVRRVALSVQAREQVAGVIGPAWLDTLDRLAPRAPLGARAGDALLVGAYRPDAAFESQALIEACQAWVRALPSTADSR